MAVPTDTIQFARWDTVPEAFITRYNDISRQGYDGHLFKFVGKRGSSSQLVCHAFFANKAAAIAEIAVWNALTGQEIYIEELDNDLNVLRKAQVFITNFTADWKEILHSDPAFTFQAIAKITVIQTADVP